MLCIHWYCQLLQEKNLKQEYSQKRNNNKNVFLTIFLGSLSIEQRKVKSGEISILGICEYIM